MSGVRGSEPSGTATPCQIEDGVRNSGEWALAQFAARVRTAGFRAILPGAGRNAQVKGQVLGHTRTLGKNGEAIGGTHRLPLCMALLL